MDRFSELIRNHRTQFDDREPSDGHFERFRERLQVNTPPRVNLLRVAVAAAIAGLILTASIGAIVNYKPLVEMVAGVSSPDLSPEVVQIDEFYRQQLSMRQQEVIESVETKSPQQKTEIWRIIFEMNQGYKRVRNDIAQWPNPERALQVLTNHYQTQMDVMDRIAAQYGDS